MLERLINNAAKWHFMFGGQDSVPITIRLIIGRGWGQGPTHSQSLQAMFAHIPGLKVVMPSNPYDCKGLLLESIFDENPVLFLEHRWIHQQQGAVPEGDLRVPIGKAKVLTEGSDVTIISMSYSTVEALRATSFLAAKGIKCDLIDLRSIQPLDWSTIFNSIRKTKRALILDTGFNFAGVGSEIASRIYTEFFSQLLCPIEKIAAPDCPVPTSFGLSDQFYMSAKDIAERVIKMTGKNINLDALTPDPSLKHDVPGEWFKGPF